MYFFIFASREPLTLNIEFQKGEKEQQNRNETNKTKKHVIQITRTQKIIEKKKKKKKQTKKEKRKKIPNTHTHKISNLFA